MAARFVVAEGQKTFESIGSARKLLKGSWWMTFLLSFITGIISGCGGCLGSIIFIIFLAAGIGFIIAKTIYCGRRDGSIGPRWARDPFDCGWLF